MSIVMEHDTTGLIPAPLSGIPPQHYWPYSSTVFDRHYVVASIAHGKCEACGEKRGGLAILPASMCSMQICAKCFFDLYAAALPTLAREYAQWAKEAA